MKITIMVIIIFIIIIITYLILIQIKAVLSLNEHMHNNNLRSPYYGKNFLSITSKCYTKLIKQDKQNDKEMTLIKFIL